MSQNNDKVESISKEEWESQLKKYHFEQASVKKLIINYLATEDKFQSEANVQPTKEVNILNKRKTIRLAILNKRAEEALKLVNELCPELLKHDRKLYFNLMELPRIDLIKCGKNEEALRLAQSQMSEAGLSYSELLRETESSLASLTIDQPTTSLSSVLSEQSHRQKVASELDSAVLKTEETAPQIEKLLKLIFWAEAELHKKGINHPKITDFL